MHFTLPKNFPRPVRWLLSSLWLVLLPLLGWGQVTLSGTSYTESFDGLTTTAPPAGWSCRINASATALGTAQTVSTNKVTWGNSSGQFNNSASVDGLTSSSTTTDQSNSTDRVIALRQTGSFADPGAAFALQISKTTGFTNFTAQFAFQNLNVQGRSIDFQVDYGVGTSPTTFTTVGSTFTQSTFGSTTVTVAFGSALDNLTGPVWIRIAALGASTGTGSRPMYAIDDFSLSYSAANTPNLNANPTSLTAFSTTVGTPSAAKTYVLTGNNLADATVTAPTGYEVSLTGAANTYFSSVTPSAATIMTTAGQTIYVRLAGSTTGTYGTSGTPLQVANTSTGATTVNVSVSGTVNAITVPSVTTAAPTSFTSTGATLGGNVTATNGATISEYGVVYSNTSTNPPTTNDSKVQMSGGTTNFSQAVALSAGTYYIRAYAINSAGTGYGTISTLIVNATPAITTLAPSQVNAGSGVQTLLINGTFPVSAAAATGITATYNGLAHTVTYVNASQVSIPLTASDVATAGNYPVIVTVPTTNNPGGGVSNTVNLSVINAVPTITSPLSPATAGAGTTIATFRVNGTGFSNTSVITFAGTALPTNYISATQLTATSVAVPTVSGTYDVTVSNPTPGGISNAATFTVTPVFATSVTTRTGFSTAVGTPSASQSYTLSGSGLPADGSIRVTLPASSGFEVSSDNTNFSQTVTIPYTGTVLSTAPATVPTVWVRLTGATAGNFSSVQVVNTVYDNSSTATATTATVTVSGFVASLTVAPTVLTGFNTTAGTFSGVLTYTLTGVNLASAVTVTPPAGYQLAQGTSTTPGTYGSNGTSISVTAAMANASGGRTIYVRLAANAPGGIYGTPSAPLFITNVSGNFSQSVAVDGTVTNPAPTITSLSPSSAAAGSTITLVVTGTGFVNGSIISFNGTSLSTTYTSATQVSASVMVPTTVGTYNVTVTNSTPGGGTATATFAAIPSMFYAKAGSDLSLLASFGTNTDGTGTAPTNFTTDGISYNITGVGQNFSANWTVSGTGSKVVLGPGAQLIIPATAYFTGTLDQSANSTLTIVNATNNAVTSLMQGAQDASSTIDLAQTSATYTVPTDDSHASGSYYLHYTNLKLTNSTKVFTGNTTTILGNLTIDNVTNVSGSSTSPFSTVEVLGNVSLTGTTSFNSALSSRVTLLLSGTASQLLSGNGNMFRLFRLTTQAGSVGAVLSDANGGTPVELGNDTSGGYNLATGTTLAVGNNTLSFISGGKAQITTNAGTLTLSAGSNLIFSKNNTAGIGSLRLTSGSTQLNNLTLDLTSGTTAALNTLTLPADLTINGTLSLTNGILAIGSNTLGLSGTVTGTGTLTGSTTSNLAIGGTGALGTLAFTSGSQILNNFTINRAGGTVALGSSLTINGALTLTTGLLTTTTTNLLTLATAATIPTSSGNNDSFINGPLARGTAAGASITLFPIGKGTAYRPLTLNASAQGVARTYTAEQFNASAATTPITGTGSGTTSAASALTRVSSVRYFTLTPSTTTGTFSGTVTLSFDTDDLVNNPGDASLVVAKRTNSTSAWGNFGRSSSTGIPNGNQPVAGTLTSDVFTTFSDFALASTDPATTNNPLPVSLTTFTATRAATGVQVAWATASEKNSNYFEVERSLDGSTFASVAKVAAQGTTTQSHTYASLDAKAPATLLYYRLRQVDLDGTVAYSPVVSVAATDGATAEFTLAPNPARERISFLTALPTAYTVRNTLGQLVRSGTTAAGTNDLLVGELPAGVYFFELHGDAGRVVRKFVKE